MLNKKQSVEELLTDIHEELRSREEKDIYPRTQTLNSYLRDLEAVVRDYIKEKRRDADNSELHVSWSLGFLAIIAITLLGLAKDNNPEFEWIRNNQFSFRLWGIALAAIYIGASLERSAFFKKLWGFSTTKIIISIAFSAAVVYATVKAAGVINTVFGVDASALPLTFTFTTAILVFKLISPFLFLLFLAVIGHIVTLYAWYIQHKEHTFHDLFPIHSLMFALLASAIMYYGWNWSNTQFNDPNLQKKVYIMAHALDFNSKHQCSNIDTDKAVIFLGQAQSSVLVSSNIETPNFSSFFHSNVQIPATFDREPCKFKNDPA